MSRKIGWSTTNTAAIRNARAWRPFSCSFAFPSKWDRGPLRPTLAVSYRYPEGQATRLKPEGDPRYSEQTLLELLKETRADLDSLLAKRQSLLRRLCGRSLKKQTVHSPKSKIGRNDPCPCGSGKKFEKMLRSLI
jgi:hypothetical protein